MTCPFCKSDQFYIKDPEDEYEMHNFQCKKGKIEFDDPADASQTDQIQPGRTVFCQRCTWKGPYEQII